MTFDQWRPFASRLVALARTEFLALAAVLAVCLGVMTFIEIADDMTEADGQAFDTMVLEALRPHADKSVPAGPWWMEEAAADITSLGGLSVLGLFALIATGFLLIQRKQLSAALLVGGLLSGVALSEGLKSLFERARPPAAFQVVETINASFPSGHTLMATIFYLSIGTMLARTVSQRRQKVYVMAVAALLALLVGLTRIYLGAHWATDVLAGWSLGIAWAMLLWLIAWAVERYQSRHATGPHDRPTPVET